MFQLCLDFQLRRSIVIQMFLKLLEDGNFMRFAKFISKQFVMSIIRSLAKTKTKGHVESNQQIVNINEGSAKDKDINLKPEKQSRNSNLDFNFYLFFSELFLYHVKSATYE